jgi:hypothetical protein
VGGLASPALPRLSPEIGPVFEPCPLQHFSNELAIAWVPHGSPRLGHVAPLHTPTYCHMSNEDLPSYHIICPVSCLYPTTCHRMDVPHVTLVVVTHVTSWLVHLSTPTSVHPISLPCVTSRSFQLCLPRQLYDRTTCTISCHVALYGLCNHHFFACLAK